MDNSYLRGACGIGRVTSAGRARVAAAMRAEGLEVLSDPTTEPLVVRAPMPSRSVAAGSVRPRFPRRTIVWAAGLVGVVLLVAIVAGSSGSESTKSARVAPPATLTQTPAAAPASTSEAPAPTLQDAQQRIDDDHYAEALAIGAATGRADLVRRRIANRIARRILFAIGIGDLRRARFLRTSASEYASTALTRQASARLQVAAEQARADRLAAEQRRQARAAAAAERRRQRDLEQAAPPSSAAPSVPSGGTCADTPLRNFPVPPGDPRDGNGDGIACES